ncbi:hypothetical protein L596_017091 [Steinernema carpocapsae]|uniref:Uncharacterized protein n=1 Tax=Steinernema carpocapsae TaxID=34508 RepID=A0A4U5N0G8_STECR|nr:hypothetical protein L596_017091 [Steinernema carpocapsae]
MKEGENLSKLIQLIQQKSVPAMQSFDTRVATNAYLATHDSWQEGDATAERILTTHHLWPALRLNFWKQQYL